jgi:hypothetical protein
VNPNGLPTTAVFEYGPTTDYGHAKAVVLSPINGSSVQTVSADLDSLPLGASYHFRLTATNANGTATGADMTFATERSAGDFLYTTSGTTATLTGYNGPGGKLNIPSILTGLSVTGIGTGAFSGKTNLTEVTIPGNVTSIGYAAFNACSRLTSVIIPGSVETIGAHAFGSCIKLTWVMIPPSVTSIEDFAFYSCSGLPAIGVDAANPAYRSMDGVLFNKAMTTLIQYPSGKEGAYAIPVNVNFIEDAAFAYCGRLTSVTIPPSVTDMGYQAFDHCANLAHVSLSGSFTRINDYAFYGCASLTSISIPDGVTRIGQQAFDACSGLTKVVIPASVTSIGSSGFNACRNLEAVLFEGNAPTEEWAFGSAAPGFTVYFCNGRTGFTTPVWKAYPAVGLGDPGIWIQPRSATILTGTTATMTVSAIGTGSLTYQWYQGLPGTATNPVGTNSPSFTTPALTVDTRYWVKVTTAANPTGADAAAAAITVASPFGPWINGFTNIAPDERSATADPDHDGIPNAVEFVIGGKPDGSGADQGLLPQATGYPSEGPGGDYVTPYWTFSHRRTLASMAAGVASDFEFSTDLAGDWTDWRAIPGVIVDVTPGPSGPDGYETVIYYYPLPWWVDSTGNLFARLKVVVP